MSFGDEHPVQPLARNPRKIGIMLMAAGVVIAGGLMAKAISQRLDPERGKAAAQPISVYTPQITNRKEWKTGYAVEAKPEPAAAPAPIVIVPPAPVTIVKAAAPAAPAPPAKPAPLGPAFIGEVSPAISRSGSKSAGQGGGVARAGGPAPAGEYRPGMDDGHEQLDADAVQGLSAQKNRWLAQAGNGGADVVSAPWMPAVSENMLQAGTILSAVTLTAINSDLPGDVVAMIPAPVCDTITGDNLLIPAGSKLLGRYSDQLAPFQERAQLAWYRIVMPDGSSQNLGSMPGVDVTGASGVKGDVDTHTMGMAGAVVLATGLSLVQQAGSIAQATEGGGGGSTAFGVVGGGLGGGADTTKTIGGKIINRQLARPNTLTIDQGTSISLLLNKDLSLPVYEGRACR